MVNTNLTNKQNIIVGYYAAATYQAVNSGNPYVTLAVPKGTYLFFGYFHRQGSVGAAWFGVNNATTDQNALNYRMIENNGSFSVYQTIAISSTATATIGLWNLSGQAVTVNSSTMIMAFKIGE